MRDVCCSGQDKRFYAVQCLGPSPYGDPIAYISYTFIDLGQECSHTRKLVAGNSLVVQWSGLGAFTVMGLGSVPDWGTEIPKNCKAWPKKEKIKLVEIFIK